jgi:hypothetical protein
MISNSMLLEKALVLADKAGTVKLDISIKLAASEIGLTHESFYPCIPTLEAKGIISRTEKRTFFIHCSK